MVSDVLVDRFIAVKSDSMTSYDSVQDGSVALWTPHTAFRDLSAPKDAPFRESIELRAFLFYD